MRKLAVAAVLGFLLAAAPLMALAASGGAMGGSSFSDSSDSNDDSSYYRYGMERENEFGSKRDRYRTEMENEFGSKRETESSWSAFFVLVPVMMIIVLLCPWINKRDVCTVYKIQVCVRDMKRSLQKELNQLAETADTSNTKGLHYVLTETALALLRRPDCFVCAYSAVDVKQSIKDAEKQFNQLSVEERVKFNEETLVNMNSIKRQTTSSQIPKDSNHEYIVSRIHLLFNLQITILLAVGGVDNIPVINSNSDLKKALQKLNSLSVKKILAVHVLWTPQLESDILTKKELLEDYPLLRVI